MSQQFIERVKLTTEFLLVWDQVVDRAMASSTQRNGRTHLVARESFLKPLVRMACARNQVMFSRPAFRDPTAQLGAARQLVTASHGSW